MDGAHFEAHIRASYQTRELQMCKYRVLLLVVAAAVASLPGCWKAPSSEHGASAEASADLDVHVGGSGAILSGGSSVARESGTSPSGAQPSGAVPTSAMLAGHFDVHSLCGGKSVDDDCILPLHGPQGSAGRCKLPTGSGSPNGDRLFCFMRLDLPCAGKSVGDDCKRATPGPRPIAGRCVAVSSHGVDGDGHLLCLTQDDLSCDRKAIGDECELPKATRFHSRGEREYKGHCRAVPSGRRGNDTILLCSPNFR